MKTRLIIFFSAITVFFGAIMVSCDKVEQPFEQEQVTGPINGVPVKSDSSKILDRKVLVEDYTGHKCGNCPKALDTIEDILLTHPGQVIPVSIHSGYYSTHTSSPYSYNWIVESPTKPGYNALDEFFQVSDQGNPNGMVNRKDYDLVNFLHVKGIDVWKAEVASILATPAQASIYLVNVYDPTNNNLQTTANVRFLSSLTGNYKIATMVVEDEVECDTLVGRILPQKDYTMNPDDDYHYIHKHVLRDYLYGAFGDSLMTNPNINDTVSRVFTRNLSGIGTGVYDWKADKLAVIVYIYNGTTYEIIQAEELKIKP